MVSAVSRTADEPDKQKVHHASHQDLRGILWFGSIKSEALECHDRYPCFKIKLNSCNSQIQYFFIHIYSYSYSFFQTNDERLSLRMPNN